MKSIKNLRKTSRRKKIRNTQKKNRKLVKKSKKGGAINEATQREKIKKVIAKVKDDLENPIMFESPKLFNSMKSQLRFLIGSIIVYRNMHASDSTSSSSSILSTNNFNDIEMQYNNNYNDKESLTGLLHEAEEYFKNAVKHYEKTHKSEQVFTRQYDDDDDDDDEMPLIKREEKPKEKSIWNMLGL